MTRVLFVVAGSLLLAGSALAGSIETAPMAGACHKEMKVSSERKCTDKASTGAAAFESCKPNECFLRVYDVVYSPPEQVKIDDPPCGPTNIKVKVDDLRGYDYDTNYAICTLLGITVPAGSTITRFRVGAVDKTHGPEGEGYCGDDTTCKALPFSSFDAYRVVENADGTKRVWVRFRNWRHDEFRRAVFQVWFTKPSGAKLVVPK